MVGEETTNQWGGFGIRADDLLPIWSNKIPVTQGRTIEEIDRSLARPATAPVRVAATQA
jgi:hypothetical protein